MFLLLMATPLTYVYLITYVCLLYILIAISNIYVFWMFIEIRILLFIRVSYSIQNKNFSSLMLYFIVQVFSSFGLIIRIMLDRTFARYFLLIKIALFPFMFWFVQTVYYFSNLVMLLRITFNKLPVLLIINLFSLPLNWNLIFWCGLFSIRVRSLLMVTSVEIKLVLVHSSIRNNLWLLLREELSAGFFFIFFLVYTLSLKILFRFFNPVTSKVFLRSFSIVSFLNLASVPLIPLFWAKLIIVYFLMTLNYRLRVIFLMLVIRVLRMLAYLQLCIKYIFYKVRWN